MRHGRRHAPARTALRFDPSSGQIILFGLISAEVFRRCDAEQRRGLAALNERIAWMAQHYPEEDDGWVERRRLWQPTAATLDFVPTSQGAPSLTVVARRQRERMYVEFTLTDVGLVRVTMSEWPAGSAVPVLPMEPTSLGDAIGWAPRVVDRALLPLFSFVDPMRA